MAIFYLILFALFTIFCLIGFIVSIRDSEWGLSCFTFLLIILSSVSLFVTIDAIRRDNTQTVEYYFPAEHYSFEQVITETSETKYIGTDTVVVVKRDTTYKLVGQDPIIGRSNHFIRKYK